MLAQQLIWKQSSQHSHFTITPQDSLHNSQLEVLCLKRTLSTLSIGCKVSPDANFASLQYIAHSI